ncbi:MAG: ABC transporter ATP-binding protein [Desulfamplus sp.]|nr:ABC transporter ATP-binding protein [Desulfamplus sp.]
MSFNDENIIEVKNLKKYFYSGLFQKECIKAVDGVSFCIPKGRTMGLVGESGSGKSTLGRCILRLIKPSSGEVYFSGEDILFKNGEPKQLRKQMQIIFQDSDGCLNPRMKAIDILLEPLRVNKFINSREREPASELIKIVNLPEDLLNRYPNELSGGQRQRIAIARAISLKPTFIVADEATASLDMLGQSQIMEVFKKLKLEYKTSFLNISHNLNFIQRTTDIAAVMYSGRFVEMGKTKDIFNNPAHPYTRSLLSARLKVTSFSIKQNNRLNKKNFSNLTQPVSGCSFYQYCPCRKSVCKDESPSKKYVSDDHWILCCH